jgi:rubrerythrin
MSEAFGCPECGFSWRPLPGVMIEPKNCPKCGTPGKRFINRGGVWEMEQ